MLFHVGRANPKPTVHGRYVFIVFGSGSNTSYFIAFGEESPPTTLLRHNETDTRPAKSQTANLTSHKVPAANAHTISYDGDQTGTMRKHSLKRETVVPSAEEAPSLPRS